MIPLVGRLPFGLGRLFGAPGPGAPAAVDGTIYPVVDLEGLLPERAFLRSERLYVAQADVLGAAGQVPAVTFSVPQITPAGGGVIAIVEYIRIQLIAVVGFISIYTGNIADAGTPATGNSPWRDLRLLQQGIPGGAQMNPQASLQSSTAGAVPPTNLQLYHSFGAVNETWQPLGGVPWIISPGTDLMVIGQTFLQRIIVQVAWRERPVTQSELTP